jgi:outer membrane protein
VHPNNMKRPCVLAALALAAAVWVVPCVSCARVYTLDECVEAAMANSTTLARAEASLAGARADVMSSWSGVLPRVSAGLSRSDNTAVAEGSETTSQGVSGSVSLSQTLFDGSTFASISGAGHSRTASEASLDATRREVILGVRQAYYGLLKAVQLREVQREALDLAKEQLRKTESLFGLGSASRSDLLKAQVQVALEELTLITAEKTAATARLGLCYAIGIDVTTDVEAVDPPADPSEDGALTYVLDEAIARRPDIRAQEETVTASRRSLLAAKAARWPDLSLSLQYARGQGSLDEFFDGMSDEYSRSVSVSLSLPVFDGLSTTASIARAKAALRSQELALKDAKLSAAYQIETARLTVDEQKSRVTTAETALARADEDLKVSEERFRLRSASMLELIDARVAYSRARADLVQARYDHESAKAELKTALGL